MSDRPKESDSGEEKIEEGSNIDGVLEMSQSKMAPRIQNHFEGLRGQVYSIYRKNKADNTTQFIEMIRGDKVSSDS